MKAFADEKIIVTQKIEIYLGMGRKRYGKMIKCWLIAFSPFTTMVSKVSITVIKSWDWVVKAQKSHQYVASVW